jgi:capsule polysaccharide export protein KpsE/RkpR
VLAQQVRTAIEQTGDLSQVSDELKKIEQALPTDQVEQLKKLADQAGIPVQVQPQVGDKLAQLKEQLSTAQSALQPSNPEAIAANAKLIEPHRQQLEKLLGMRMVLGADSLLDGIKKAASEAAQAPAAAGGQQ